MRPIASLDAPHILLHCSRVSSQRPAVPPLRDKTLDPTYEHASPEAYERWRDLKYGLRIHWGIYSQYGFEASWPVLQMSNEDKSGSISRPYPAV